MHDVVEPRAQHSTAVVQSPLHNASKDPSSCRLRVRIKRSMSRLLSCSMELSAFASRLFATKMLDHLLLLHLSVISNPFFLASERSGRHCPLREAPCMSYRLKMPALSLPYSPMDIPGYQLEVLVKHQDTIQSPAPRNLVFVFNWSDVSMFSPLFFSSF